MDSQLGECEVDKESVVSASTFKSGSIANSIMFGVAAEEARLQGALAVNVCAKKLNLAPGAVAYNVVDNSDEGLTLGENEVRVGVFTQDPENAYFEMKSNWDEIDGGKSFKTAVCGNARSFHEVYELNQGADVTACGKMSA